MLNCVTLELVSDNQYLTISVFYVNLHKNILIVLQAASIYITSITTYSASYLVATVYPIISGDLFMTQYSIKLATVGTVTIIV